jgi:hypothetical protein
LPGALAYLGVVGVVPERRTSVNQFFFLGTPTTSTLKCYTLFWIKIHDRWIFPISFNGIFDSTDWQTHFHHFEILQKQVLAKTVTI